MYKDIDNTQYDYVVFGTSLEESILSAFLAKTGKKILHVDISKFYGGDCKNFNLKDLSSFLIYLKNDTVSDRHMRNFKLLEEKYVKSDFFETEDGRAYNFDFNPKLIYSKSKATEELTNSKASNYLEFVSVKKIFVHFLNKFLSVPCTKSEIFVSDDLELVEKQKLLNFIYAVIKICSKEVDVNTTVDIKKDYELEGEILEDIKTNMEQSAVEFLQKRFTSKLQTIIKLVLSNNDPNLEDFSLINVDQLIKRVYKFLISLQVYDDTPFLYPQYGSSEFSQALCRLSAVNQSIFIVHDKITVKIGYNNGKFLNDEEKKFAIGVYDTSNDEHFLVTANHLILNENFLHFDNSFEFSGEILTKEITITKGKSSKRFTSFYIIEGEEEKRKIKEGPVIFKVEKNDPLYNNEYGVTAIEFFMNSNSVPRNRSMLSVIINFADGIDEADFTSKCSLIADNFFKHHLNNLNQGETENFTLIASFKFYQEIKNNNIKNIHDSNGDIILTENNYTDIDLDFYYNQAEKVAQENKWTLQTEKEKDDLSYSNFNDEQTADNLIDELFNSI